MKMTDKQMLHTNCLQRGVRRDSRLETRRWLPPNAPPWPRPRGAGLPQACALRAGSGGAGRGLQCAVSPASLGWGRVGFGLSSPRLRPWRTIVRTQSMVGVASGCRSPVLTWEGGGFEEGRHLRALKRSWLQAGLRPFCPRPQASASRAGSAGALGPSPGCPPCLFSGNLQAYSLPERWTGTYGACSSPGGPVIWED